MIFERKDHDIVSAPANPAPDLWCTYAAVRTLRWLNYAFNDDFFERTLAYINSRRNSDGGYGWSRGMQSDAWATFYSTQAIVDLGSIIPNLSRTQDWLWTTWDGNAFGMLPGQRPDIWATHFSARTAIEICRELPPGTSSLLRWLGSLQTSTGGLSWSPEHANQGLADARACFYGVMAWRAISTKVNVAPPWDITKLSSWLQDRQHSEGGFTFSERAKIPCMWATYRATQTLAALGKPCADPDQCVRWIMRQRGKNGAFVRWQSYPIEDVWASFCAIGSLNALGKKAEIESVRPSVRYVLGTMQCSNGGFTYRETGKAADVLSTSAKILEGTPNRDEARQLVSWIESCQLPNEPGVMYMPGRGAEVRCTLWALAAGAFIQGNYESPRPELNELVDWLLGLQNPDGGFGYWEGRGSDMVSTAAAIEAISLAGHPTALPSVIGFIESCHQPDTAGEDTYSNVPGGQPRYARGCKPIGSVT
ncbi:terpene cyclase/mutase family protein [Sodalis ligni]|uniref:prenyltransferase/squalene oxidase repeat-containing protein n=1 Tax=Sodalis ligni TaxID=2697027 RepID=UPI001BDF09A4|nr:prenyltransferase/squalene oxidase repeat-containing protein [Sodalis ligni]QWA09117.1 terpene cyclase/mutase family protein [Sodalis ligni]